MGAKIRIQEPNFGDLNKWPDFKSADHPKVEGPGENVHQYI